MLLKENNFFISVSVKRILVLTFFIRTKIQTFLLKDICALRGALGLILHHWRPTFGKRPAFVRYQCRTNRSCCSVHRYTLLRAPVFLPKSFGIWNACRCIQQRALPCCDSPRRSHRVHVCLCVFLHVPGDWVIWRSSFFFGLFF